MSNPLVLYPFGNRAWVAHCGPPLFLSSSIELMAEGGQYVYQV